MNRKSKIYLAGHTGLVGSAVYRKMLSDGYENIIIRTQKELDLLDQNAVQHFFEKENIEYVILCAAKVGGIKENMAHPADFIYENTQIQNNVIWYALKHDIKKLLFLGSSCIYPRECKQPMSEDYLMNGKLEPTNEAYAVAKIAGIKLCESIYTQYKRKFISCMPTNIYGIRDNFNIETSHVIPALIRRIHEAKENKDLNVTIWGSGNSRREFLYVDDLADAIVWLMCKYEEKEFLNIGTGKDISIKELAFLIKDIVGFDGNLIFDLSKPDGMPKKLLNTEKINKLGWRYKTELKDGLEITYKYYLENKNKW